jgi:hypothetical protein
MMISNVQKCLALKSFASRPYGVLKWLALIIIGKNTRHLGHRLSNLCHYLTPVYSITIWEKVRQ